MVAMTPIWNLPYYQTNDRPSLHTATELLAKATNEALNDVKDQSTIPVARLHRFFNGTKTHAINTPVLFVPNNSNSNRSGMFSSTPNESRNVAVEADYHDISFAARFNTNGTTGTMEYMVRMNAGGSPTGGTLVCLDVVDARIQTYRTVIQGMFFQLGAYVELWITNKSDVSRTMATSGATQAGNYFDLRQVL